MTIYLFALWRLLRWLMSLARPRRRTLVQPTHVGPPGNRVRYIGPPVDLAETENPNWLVCFDGDDRVFDCSD